MQRYVKLGNHSRSFDVHQNWVTLDEIVKMSCDSRLCIYISCIYIFIYKFLLVELAELGTCIESSLYGTTRLESTVIKT